LARAFTLIEVLTVVAIAGMLAALAAPSISSMTQRARASVGVEETVAALEVARARARSSRCELRVTPHPTSSAFVVAPNPADPTPACVALPVKVVPIDRAVTFASFTLDGTPLSALAFLPSGAVAGRVPTKLKLTLRSGGTATIEVWPAVGTVRVH
jgi:prepilin-type N-terminal cleavage/methylation domain-containing protein